MMDTAISPPLNWRDLRLVAFDVDGTLYDQRKLRFFMAIELLRDALAHGPRNLLVLRTYRRLREHFAEVETPDFETALIAATALRLGCTEASVRAVVEEWIEQRPLRHMARCRYPGVAELFVRLRQTGRRVAIFSDYPAREKIAALGLEADLVVTAGDVDVGVLKPNPKGLLRLIDQAGVDARETLMIGDRISRDGVAALRAGAPALIRSSRKVEQWQTFRSYDDPVFKIIDRL